MAAYDAEHAAGKAARGRAYRETHREHRLRYLSAYRASHKAERSAYNRAHKHEINAYNRAYRAEHPELARACDRRKRAKRLSAVGTHTAADIAAQRTRQRGRCYWCGERVGRHYHVDHVVPLSRGGSNGPENLVIACAECNLSKGAKLPHEWSDRLL